MQFSTPLSRHIATETFFGARPWQPNQPYACTCFVQAWKILEIAVGFSWELKTFLEGMGIFGLDAAREREDQIDLYGDLNKLNEVKWGCLLHGVQIFFVEWHGNNGCRTSILWELVNNICEYLWISAPTGVLLRPAPTGTLFSMTTCRPPSSLRRSTTIVMNPMCGAGCLNFMDILLALSIQEDVLIDTRLHRRRNHVMSIRYQNHTKAYLLASDLTHTTDYF